MKRFLAILFLASALTARADMYVGHVTVTNQPAHGATLIINASTNTWVTNVTSAAVQTLIGTNGISSSATNLVKHYASYPLAVNIYAQQNVTNRVTFFAVGGATLAISAAGGWASIAITTNVQTTAYTVRVPISAEPSAAQRTNVANWILQGLNAYGTTSMDASLLGAVVGTNLWASTNANFQSQLGSKQTTNAALDALSLNNAANLTNFPAGLTNSLYPASNPSNYITAALGADNLGDHTATNDLDMAGFNILQAGDITATNAIHVDGADITENAFSAPKGTLHMNQRYLSFSDTGAQIANDVDFDWTVTSNLTVLGTITGEGSGITGVTASSTNAEFTVIGAGVTNTVARTIEATGAVLTNHVVAGPVSTLQFGAGGGGGNLVLLVATNLAAAVTNVNITTDINADGSYLVQTVFTNAGGGASNYRLFVNGDTTEGNYYNQYLYATATSVTGARENVFPIGALDAAKSDAAEIVVLKDKTGFTRFFLTGGVDGGTPSGVDLLYRRAVHNVSVGNVTQLTFRATAADGIGAGSTIVIYKRTQQ